MSRLSAPWSSTVELDRFFIGGEWHRDTSRQCVPIIEPATERVAGTAELATLRDAEAAASAAAAAFEQGSWSGLGFAERAGYLARLADAIGANAEEFAHYYVEFEANIASPHALTTTINILRDYARIGQELSDGPEQRHDFSGSPVLMNRLPTGSVCAIVPWNAPLILAVLKLAPVLVAGCR